ncbi:MAG: hypothetical protein ACE5QW_06460 [Thermoplasmata archaeon]
MNKHAQVIGVAFILVSIFSAVTLALTVDKYQAVADARVRLSSGSGNIWIKDIWIPPINGTDSPVRVTILIEFDNPTRVDVWVYNVEFTLWVFNESNLEKIENPQVMDESYVDVGGFNRLNNPQDFVPSGGNVTLKAHTTVTSAEKIRVLNTTDSDGKYHPLVTADLRYTIVDVDILVVVQGLYYFNEFGVEPHVG